jgi:phage-related protein
VAGPQDLQVKVSVDASGVTAGVTQAQEKLKQFGEAAKAQSENTSKLKDSVKDLGKSFVELFAAAEIIKFLTESAHAAIANQESFGLMAQQLHNTVGATKEQSVAIDANLKKLGEQAGVVQTELRPAYESLIRSTGSTTEAMKLQKVALDLAAGAHVPLEVAAKALGKAYDGQTGALQKLVPAVKGVKDPIDAVAKSMKGMAEKAADLNPMARMKVMLEEIQVSVGTALLPVFKVFSQLLLSLMPIVTSVAKFLGQLVAAFMPLVNHILSAVMPTFANLMQLILKVINIVIMPLVKVLDAVLVPVLALVTSYINDYFIPGWNFLAEILKPIIDLVAGVLVNAFNGLNKVFQAVGKFLKPVFDGFKTFLSVAIQVYDHVGKKLMVIFQAFGNYIMQHLTPIWNNLMKALTPVANWIKDVLGAAWKWLLESVLKPVYNFLKPMIDAVSSFLGLKDIKWNVTTTTDANTDKVLGGMPNLTGNVPASAGGGGTGGTKTADAGKALSAFLTKEQLKVVEAQKAYDKAVGDAQDAFNKKSADLAGARDKALTDLEEKHTQKMADIQKSYADKLQGIVQQSMDRLRGAFASATATDVGAMFSSMLSKAGPAMQQVTQIVKNGVTSVVTFWGSTASAGVTDLVAQMQTKLAAMKTLQQNAATLAGLGFSQTFIEQVVAQGPEAGNAMAEALKNATPETQKQLQDVFSETEKTSATGMDALAKQMYDKTGLATDALKTMYSSTQTELVTALSDEQKSYASSVSDINDTFAKGMRDANDALTKAMGDAADALNKSLDGIDASMTAYLLKSKANLKAYAGEIAALRNSINGSYVAPTYDTTTGLTTSGNVSAPGSFMNTVGYNSGQGPTVVVNANTNATPQSIGDAVAFAIRNGSPYTYNQIMSELHG